MIKPMFKEDKAAQAAALLLKLRGGQMSHLKLMKLLYLAEREALLRLGRPITFDSLVSMDHGPVLSQTLNLLHGESQGAGFWEKAISTPVKNEVSLLNDPGDDKLSEAEIQIIRDVFSKFGKLTRWEIRDLTHKLAEWQDPKGSSIRIEYKEVLVAGEKTEAEVESILDDIEGLGLMDKYLGH